MRRLVPVLCLIAPAAWGECLTLGELGYVMPVEADVTLVVGDGMVTLDLAPGGRAPKTITITSLQGRDLEPDQTLRREELPNGLILHSRGTTGEAVGSGGAEVRLGGWLEGDIPLGVSCWTQGEYIGPRWCVPWLASLRLETEGCEMKED